MYVVRDPLGPAIATYNYNKRFRARILKYWPKTTVNGVEVFDRLYLWIEGVGVLQDDAHRKLYGLLGIKISKLESQDYKGITNTYLDVNMVLDMYSMTVAQIKAYINDSSPQMYPNNPNVFSSDPAIPASDNYNPDPYQNNPKYTDEYMNTIVLDKNGNLPADLLPQPQWDNYGWITDYVVYQPNDVTADYRYSDNISDTDILNLVKANDTRYIEMDHTAFSNPIFFAALKDTAGVLYEKRYRIVEKQLVKKTQVTHRIGKYSTNTYSTKSDVVKHATIEVQYRRIMDVNDVSVAGLLEAIRIDVDNLDNDGSNAPVKDRITSTLTNKYSGRIHQMKLMHEVKVGYGAKTINNNLYVPDFFGTKVINAGSGIRVDTMSNVRARAFGGLFNKAINFRYTKKKVSRWKKILVVVIDIIVVILIVVATIAGQIQLIPVILSVGSLAQSGLAAYWMGEGDYAAAGYAGKHAQYLGKAAEIANYIINPLLSVGLVVLDYVLKEMNVDKEWRMVAKMIAIVAYGASKDGGSPSKAVNEAGKEASKNIVNLVVDVIDKIKAEGIDGLVADIIKGIGDSLDSISVNSLMSNFSITDWINLLSMSFKVYTIHNDPSNAISDKQAQIQKQKDHLATMKGPEAIDSVWQSWNSPTENYMDVNGKMEAAVNNSAHSLNANLMNKYFNSGY